jgi:acetyl esterase/lipase
LNLLREALEGTDERVRSGAVSARPSYNDSATGYFLTRSLMYWFWDTYCSPADRTDPRPTPLRGKLAGLRPAFVVTCEFDP